MVAAIIISFFRVAHSPERKLLVLIVGLLFIVCSPGWELHIERGTVYIWYAFLFCLSYHAHSNFGKYGQTVSGALIGVTIWLRPISIFMLLPFAILRKVRFLVGVALGLLLSVLPTLAATDLTDWQHYYMTATGDYSLVDWSKPWPPEFPELVEESPADFYFQAAPILHDNPSIRSFVSWYFGKNLGNVEAYSLLAVLAIVLYFLLRKSFVAGDRERLFLAGFAIYILAEVFLPYRHITNYPQWIFPLMILCKALGFWTLIWRMVRPPWTTPAGSSGAPGLASDSCVARGATSRCRLS